MEPATTRNPSHRQPTATHTATPRYPTSTGTIDTRPTALTAMTTAAVLLLAACAPATVAPSISDWCWMHFGLAPTGALIADDGPPFPTDAPAWIAWLDATTPAPPERAAAHHLQLELVEGFASAGAWTSAEREQYRAAALADPTPATTCETVGARIIPRPDGALPADWQQRFLDPANPASSALATRAAS